MHLSVWRVTRGAARPRGGTRCPPLPGAPAPQEGACGALGFNLNFPQKGRSALTVSLRTTVTAKRLGFSSLCYFNLPRFGSGEQYCPFINPGSSAKAQL